MGQRPGLSRWWHAGHMQRLGTPSWRIKVDNGRGLNAACYLRDVAGIVASDDPWVPPPLAGVEFGAPSSLAADAVLGWGQWWRELVARVGLRLDGQSPQPPGDSVRAACPALGRIADDLFPTAARWASDPVRRRPPPSLPLLPPADDRRRRMDWNRTTAEQVIRDYAVSPDRVQAHIELLWSAEPWADQPAPGLLLCSIATWSDGDTYRAALKSTFENGLGGSALGAMPA